MRALVWTVLALLLVCVGAGEARLTGAPVHLTIVHTNDLHGYIENLPAIAAVARTARSQNPNTLLLDAGDCITGTPVSTLFKGEPVFEIMTLMGYDAGILGNHEFDHGWRQVEKFRTLSGHPLLNANALDPQGRPLGDAPYEIFTVGGVRVGVIGLLTGDIATLTVAENWAGCRVEPPLEAARRIVPEVRRKADFVVLLTHVGVEIDAAIAGAVPGIDLVVGGHSHTDLKSPILVKSDGRQIPIVQAFRYGKRVGVVDFDWDPVSKSVKDFKSRLVEIDPPTMANAPDVKQFVDQWLARANQKLDLSEVVGVTKTKLSRDKLRAALERIYADALGVEFGFQNLHGVRAEIDAGDIRVEHIFRVLPFENVLVKVRLKGDQVPEYARKRLGSKFDPAKEYVFATNSYVGDQRKKYFRAPDAPVETTALSMRDTVVEWVRAHQGFAADDSLPERGDDDEDKKR